MFLEQRIPVDARRGNRPRPRERARSCAGPGRVPGASGRWPPAARGWPGSARPARRRTGQRHDQRRDRRRHRRAVPPRPRRASRDERLAPGRDRLVGHPALEVVGQGPRPRRSGPPARVAIALRQTASSARSIDGSSCARRRELAPLHRCGAPRRRRPPRTAACRSAGSRAWPPGCRRRAAARAGRGRPAACSGLM